MKQFVLTGFNKYRRAFPSTLTVTFWGDTPVALTNEADIKAAEEDSHLVEYVLPKPAKVVVVKGEKKVEVVRVEEKVKAEIKEKIKATSSKKVENKKVSGKKPFSKK